jgi:hypothetical protein
MRSPPSRQPPSTAILAKSGKRRCWPIRLGNGSRQTGRSAPSVKRPRPTEWGLHSPITNCLAAARAAAHHPQQPGSLELVNRSNTPLLASSAREGHGILFAAPCESLRFTENGKCSRRSGTPASNCRTTLECRNAYGVTSRVMPALAAARRNMVRSRHVQGVPSPRSNNGSPSGRSAAARRNVAAKAGGIGSGRCSVFRRRPLRLVGTISRGAVPASWRSRISTRSSCDARAPVTAASSTNSPKAESSSCAAATTARITSSGRMTLRTCSASGSRASPVFQAPALTMRGSSLAASVSAAAKARAVRSADAGFHQPIAPRAQLLCRQKRDRPGGERAGDVVAHAGDIPTAAPRARRLAS